MVFTIKINWPQIHMCPPNPERPLPASPPHSSGLSQSAGFGCSASCIQLALVICFPYGNIDASVLFSLAPVVEAGRFGPNFKQF